MRKLHDRHGDNQWSTHVGRLKTEQRLGSRAVGPPPLIITTLWTCSGYSWARKVQKDTLEGKGKDESLAISNVKVKSKTEWIRQHRKNRPLTHMNAQWEYSAVLHISWIWFLRHQQGRKMCRQLWFEVQSCLHGQLGLVRSPHNRAERNSPAGSPIYPKSLLLHEWRTVPRQGVSLCTG